MTQDQRDYYIKQIETLPERMEEQIRTYSIKQLDTPYGEGKWTVRQVVHHLVDAHMQGYIRTKWALTEDNPTIKPYDQDDWAKLVDYTMPIDASVAILKGLHQRWGFLFRHLSEEEWHRPIKHPENFFSDIEGILVGYAGHGEKHLGHIQLVG